MSATDGLFRERFRFIRDDVFLYAILFEDTNKQMLILEKINPKSGNVEYRETITCIHTAVMDLPIEEFIECQDDPMLNEELRRKSLNIRSSEMIHEINLEPREKFLAFKSWAAGIAEAGIRAFEFQSEIESNIKHAIPLIHRFYRFFSQFDTEIIKEQLLFLERACRFEGEYHVSSLIANIEPMIDSILINKDLMEFYFDIEFPLEVYDSDEFISAILRLRRIRNDYDEGLYCKEKLLDELDHTCHVACYSRFLADEFIGMGFPSWVYSIDDTIKKYIEIRGFRADFNKGIYDGLICDEDTIIFSSLLQTLFNWGDTGDFMFYVQIFYRYMRIWQIMTSYNEGLNNEQEIKIMIKSAMKKDTYNFCKNKPLVRYLIGKDFPFSVYTTYMPIFSAYLRRNPWALIEKLESIKNGKIMHPDDVDWLIRGVVKSNELIKICIRMDMAPEFYDGHKKLQEKYSSVHN